MVAKLTFGRDRRLRRRADFVRVQGSGRRVTTPHFVLLLSPQPRPVPALQRAVSADALAPPQLPSKAPQDARLGLVVSRKAGHAVARARIKRLCRECFRTWPATSISGAAGGLVPRGVDLVVIARAGAAELTLADVQREWRAVERQIAKRAAEALAQPDGAPHVAAIRRR